MTFRNGIPSEQKLVNTEPIEAETLEEAKELASQKIQDVDPMPVHAIV